MLENGLTFYEAAESAAPGAPAERSGPAGVRKADGDAVESPDAVLEKDLQAQIESLRLRYSDRYPEVKVLLAELARVRSRKAMVASTAPVVGN